MSTSKADTLSKAQRKLKVDFGGINERNIGTLKLLNETILPVRYSDKVYNEILTTPKEFTKFAYYKSIVVGAICGRLEEKPKETFKLYIMTLGTLPAYRGRGIGSQLLTSLMEGTKEYRDIEEIYLHVQTNNSNAISFYKKFGFEVTGEIKGYYKNIPPPLDCFILAKKIASEETNANAIIATGDS